MQEVYRIQANKPWRDSNTYYTTNKAFFEYLRACENQDDTLLNNIDFSLFSR